MVEENDTPSYSKELAVTNPASLLEMAQRVHDDFVAKGKARAEELEFDAQEKYNELVSSAKEFHDITVLETETNATAIIEDAQLSAFSLISDAKVKADGIVSDARESIVRLEASILKLQEFEAAYRGNLQALVSGAQATLAVDDTELPAPDSDEAPTAESINFAEIVDRALKPGADVILVGSVRDLETAEVNTVDETADSYADDVVGSEDDENAESAPVIYTLAEETPEAIYYDPLAAKSSIDSATVASILDQSGLDTDSFHEPIPAIIGGIGAGKSFASDEGAEDRTDSDEIPSVIINANPGSGWSLDSEEIDEDVDSDETSSDEVENDSAVSHDKDSEDKGKK